MAMSGSNAEAEPRLPLSEVVPDGTVDPAPPPSEAWGLAEGDEIVPGRIALESLGGGYDFEAYLAWDDERYALVVAKIVRPHLVEDDHTLRNLAREAAVLDRLAHPVIVRGFDVVPDGPRPHLVLEHLEGPTLASTIRRFGPLELDQVLPLGFQLSSALAYLRAVEIVHLDVKPRNVILGVPPRLIDFSVARGIEPAQRITSAIGTDAYMAPEQCDPSLGRIGPAADVWGLGATLFHAVAGHVPFPQAEDHDEDDPRQRWPQLHADPYELPTGTPPDLEETILDCLEFDPERRPTPAEIAVRLEPLLGNLTKGRVLGRARPSLH
ncbi:MAG: serine/threonine-protein kinase [Actinomycetota bacterium]